MKENHFLDDGAYSAVQIIIETVRRRLAGEGDIAVELLKDLKEAKDASEFRMKITVSLFTSVVLADTWCAKFCMLLTCCRLQLCYMSDLRFRVYGILGDTGVTVVTVQ